jgi:hypothetical protein
MTAPTPATPQTIWTTPGPNTRFGAISPVEMLRRAHTRLAERFDPSRTRHKPLSILRQEGRRLLDQYFDSEWNTLPKPEREKLIEEILSEAPGFGPLEELFRDDSTKEIMVIAATQVIAKKGEGWLPTSVRFRDSGQLRSYLARLSETVESRAAAPAAGGGFDVKLANGFRVLAILPPEILDQSPLVLFVRGEPLPLLAGASSVTMAKLHRDMPSGVTPPPAPRPMTPNPSGSVPAPIPPLPPRFGPVAMPPAQPTLVLDPNGRFRQRVTERIISKCAAAGVYDLSAIPSAELQRVIHAHVLESSMLDKFPLDDSAKERMVLEILAKMNR